MNGKRLSSGLSRSPALAFLCHILVSDSLKNSFIEACEVWQMGWWKTGQGDDAIGDPPLDILARFDEARGWKTRSDIPPKTSRAIAKAYRDGLGRDPTDSEIVALLDYNR